ncbi:bifunctional oligoribonuclease/PAP phosphatase NrnA [Apilactobacillus micheneri]|uniref:Bifunctional oligoribonuclease/PAP phosphatase NrnA n=1 Tax=Apilactobacillus micheneri TaxID=1899430 RepID=A0A9Q8ILQ1_9LACO|nr:bifunctional oligoribonuclease/PAP phosphatase NrnA [Apilactobacillus micheneri]TPR43505.1 bifunctional oligoribonuclease/PAP phosphatase NrnA [Apilactobacillus micheneri]
MQKILKAFNLSTEKKIIKAICDFDTIIIHRHQRPDPDAYGSQMGLANIIKTSFPNKKVYCVGKQYHGFDWLGKTDNIDDDVYKNALVIVCDTANQPRVDDSRYNKGKMMIKIDHHPNDDQFGDIMWVKPEASSTSELIYDLYDASKKLKINDEAGRLLYAGIVGDTGRFKYPSTSANTFRVASELAKLNFSTTEVNNIESEIDIPLARLSAYVYENLNIKDSGAAYLILSDKVLEPFNLGDESTSAVVPLPGNIKQVSSWAIFVQQKDGSYRIRLRSKGPSINELAKKFGGGGHPLAIGAVAKDDEEIKQVIEQLDTLVADYKGDK